MAGQGELTMKTRRIAIAAAVVAAFLASCASESTVDQSAGASSPQARTAESSPAPQAAPAAQQARPASTTAAEPSKRSVYYEFDRYDVKDEYRALVEAHARYLREHPRAQVAVQGNADERGSREYNLALGQRRSEGVKKMLTLLGVAERQIEATSFGEEKPRAVGHDEASWAENRRSDIVPANPAP
jgi:peptidoglycan-associated lipoprotein